MSDLVAVALIVLAGQIITAAPGVLQARVNGRKSDQLITAVADVHQQGNSKLDQLRKLIEQKSDKIAEQTGTIATRDATIAAQEKGAP